MGSIDKLLSTVLSIAVNESQPYQKIKFLGIPSIKPGAAGCKTRTQSDVLCGPLNSFLFHREVWFECFKNNIISFWSKAETENVPNSFFVLGIATMNKTDFGRCNFLVAIANRDIRKLLFSLSPSYGPKTQTGHKLT